MFTVPVGNFSQTSTYIRPTSCTAVATGTGAIANPGSSYDLDTNTYCEVTSSDNGTASLTWDVFPLSAITNPTINILCSGEGVWALPTITVSVDGGTSYPYTMDLSVTSTKLKTPLSYIDYRFVCPNGEAVQTKNWASLKITGVFVTSSLRVKLYTATSYNGIPTVPELTDTKVYDIYISR